MSTELVHVGFGNILAIDKVLAIVSPGSAPIKRMIQAGKSKRLLIDLTSGRKTKAVIIMESGHIVLVALNAETIASRVAASRSGGVKPD
jgi:extracellular matrix regulatory protein A